MPRPSKHLKTKYGKLTVLSEGTIEGRRQAMVQCACGVTKMVYADALRSGRTRSCGAIACRLHTTKVDRRFRPRGSRSLPVATLRRVWDAVNNPKRPMTVTAAAEKYGIENRAALYTAFRAVKKCGGMDRYLQLVR